MPIAQWIFERNWKRALVEAVDRDAFALQVLKEARGLGRSRDLAIGQRRQTQADALDLAVDDPLHGAHRFDVNFEAAIVHALVEQPQAAFLSRHWP
jgi:hypothetical protein